MKLTKKPLSGVMAKKELQGRLEKCYICSKFLSSASQLMVHIQEHQNKINRTTVEEIQRKTQESFRTKRQPSALARKNDKVEEVKPKEPIGGNGKQNTFPKKQEEEEGDQSEESYEEALRQSQILLEKIDFLTQVPEETKEKEVIAVVEEEKEEESTIDGDYQLYLQLKTCSSDAEAQTLIIRTDFEDQSFENYQEQLKHLKNLMKIAVNPDSINKIASISKNITKDVTASLKAKYDSLASLQGNAKNQKQTLTNNNNKGELRYCSVCYSTIEASSEFLQSQFGSAYHKECLQE